MDYNRILHGISNKDLVNFVKYDLGVMLEDENEAYENEMVDRIKGRLDEDKKVLIKFTSLNKEKTLLICFKPYDYELIECSISFDLKVKKRKVETEEKHFQHKKDYFRFMARQIERVYGVFGRDKYEKRANAIVNRYEEKNTLEK